MRLWVKTFRRISFFWLDHWTAAIEALSRRLVRLKALSICHRWP